MPGPDREVQFDGDKITFEPQGDFQDGWTITPLTPLRVSHLSE